MAVQAAETDDETEIQRERQQYFERDDGFVQRQQGHFVGAQQSAGGIGQEACEAVGQEHHR